MIHSVVQVIVFCFLDGILCTDVRVGYVSFAKQRVGVKTLLRKVCQILALIKQDRKTNCIKWTMNWLLFFLFSRWHPMHGCMCWLCVFFAEQRVGVKTLLRKVFQILALFKQERKTDYIKWKMNCKK